MSKRNKYITAAVLIGALVTYLLFRSMGPDQEPTLTVEVKSGTFDIQITTTGELFAKNSEEITGPSAMGLRNARIFQYSIEDIVADGTVVDSGDWVASLDRSDLDNKVKDQELEVEKLENQFLKTQLDTTMNLRSARDELVNLNYTLEEKQIVVDQSIYEPPATQRQAKIDLDKAVRAYKQAVENYDLKYQKANTEMKEVATNLEKARRKYNELTKLNEQFTIRAPKAGMLTYKRGWDGKKQGVGAQISAWDNVVATLPNLTIMNSQTYINEIDISKVAVGQPVEIVVDAFPGKTFTGKVTEVANMGEQMQNSSAKVFEVIIEIDGQDSILRPSMTTKNIITTDHYDSVNYLPIEALFANDSLSFVYMSNKKQQVIAGKNNETDIIILEGLQEEDEVYVLPPQNAQDWEIEYLPTELVMKYEQTTTELKQPDKKPEEAYKSKRNTQNKRNKP